MYMGKEVPDKKVGCLDHKVSDSHGVFSAGYRQVAFAVCRGAEFAGHH